MLTVEQCKKILGERARNYTNEQIEAIRDELYVAANLAFTHWQKKCSSTEGDGAASPSVGEQSPTSAL